MQSTLFLLVFVCMHVLICEWQCRPFVGSMFIIIVCNSELCQVSCQCHVWPPIIPVVHFPCSSTSLWSCGTIPRPFPCSSTTGSASSNRNAVHSFPQQVSSRCIFLLLHGRSSVVFHRYHTRRHDKRTIVVHSSKDASN